jgi:hypothetical protein
MSLGSTLWYLVPQLALSYPFAQPYFMDQFQHHSLTIITMNFQIWPNLSGPLQTVVPIQEWANFTHSLKHSRTMQELIATHIWASIPSGDLEYLFKIRYLWVRMVSFWNLEGERILGSIFCPLSLWDTIFVFRLQEESECDSALGKEGMSLGSSEVKGLCIICHITNSEDHCSGLKGQKSKTLPLCDLENLFTNLYVVEEICWKENGID